MQSHVLRPQKRKRPCSVHLVTERLELLLDVVWNSSLLLCLGQALACSPLLLVVCLALDLSPLLETCNDILVLPAELVTQTTNGAVLAAWLEAEHTESLWDDHALLVVVWWWDTLEGLQALESLCAALGLVRDHATHCAPEHLGGCAVVPWSTTHCVVTGLLAEEGLVLHCRGIVLVCMSGRASCGGGFVKRTLSAEELAGDVEGLAADDDNLLAIEELLGDSRGQTTEEVALAVDYNL